MATIGLGSFDGSRRILGGNPFSGFSHLAKPVIHYESLAAGRNEPLAAFRYAPSKMRPTDVACLGIYTKHRSDELREDVHRLQKCLREAPARADSAPPD